MNDSTYGSSRLDEQHAGNDRVIVKPFPPEPLTLEDRERLKRLAEMSDDQIDTTDIPELLPGTPYIFNPYVPAGARLKKVS